MAERIRSAFIAERGVGTFFFAALAVLFGLIATLSVIARVLQRQTGDFANLIASKNSIDCSVDVRYVRRTVLSRRFAHAPGNPASRVRVRRHGIGHLALVLLHGLGRSVLSGSERWPAIHSRWSATARSWPQRCPTGGVPVRA